MRGLDCFAVRRLTIAVIAAALGLWAAVRAIDQENRLLWRR